MKFSSRIYYVHRFMRSLFTLALIVVIIVSCDHIEEPSAEQAMLSSVVIHTTDSSEWCVCLFKEHLLYSEAVQTNLPAPWVLPTKDEASLLRKLHFASPSQERFITSDGYTFAMPSASVSKAGAKTKYSVLGLYIRKTTIDVEF